MAVNVDDIIASMQSVHAGDRGQGLEEIRENLRATLGHQALGPASGYGSSSASTSRQPSGGANHRKRRTTPQFRVPHAAPGLEASGHTQVSSSFVGDGYDGTGEPDATTITGSHSSACGQEPLSTSATSSSSSAPDLLGNHLQQGWSTQSGDYNHLGNGSSDNYGTIAARSFGSVGSWNASSAGSSGFGIAIGPPANTPQQTPSDRGSHCFANAYANNSSVFGMGVEGIHQYALTGGFDCVSEAASPSASDVHGVASDSAMMAGALSNSPRRLVSGFNPVETPVQYH